MDFNIILDALASQGIWCLLFCYLFYSSREESKDREDKLLLIIEEHSEKLKEISDTLYAINLKVDKLESVSSEIRGTVDL